MSDLQEKLEKALRETLKDPEGAGSDLVMADDGPGDEWLYVQGNLDVQHLASHAIDTLGLAYEYMLMMQRPGRPWVEWDHDWTADADGVISNSLTANTVAQVWKTGVKFKVVRRLKAGPEEDV